MIKFKYTNHRGEDHEYLVRPQNIEFSRYGAEGPLCWNLRGFVHQRDGEDWPRMRIFKLTGLREVKEVQEP